MEQERVHQSGRVRKIMGTRFVYSRESTYGSDQNRQI